MAKTKNSRRNNMFIYYFQIFSQKFRNKIPIRTFRELKPIFQILRNNISLCIGLREVLYVQLYKKKKNKKISPLHFKVLYQLAHMASIDCDTHMKVTSVYTDGDIGTAPGHTAAFTISHIIKSDRSINV